MQRHAGHGILLGEDQLGEKSMPSKEFEYSNYSRSLMIGENDADIEIYREPGTHAWHLEMKINGKIVEWPHVFIADKAAFDAAIKHLKERGLDPDMFQDDDFVLIESPLNQSVMIEGHRFDIEIYRGADETDWILEIVNEKGTSIIPDARFPTDQDALGAAMADFENEPIEEFIG